mgnify:CR=1 FL=1|jgi:hypothetical protein
MPTYDKDNNLIEPTRFTPEPEGDGFTPAVSTKRGKTQKNHTPKVKPTLKRRLAKWLVLLTLALGLLLSAAYGIDYFFDRNTINWQTPIKLQTPIYLSPRTQAQAKQVEVVPTAQAVAPVAKEEVKPVVDYDEILRIVYRKESSSGKNDGCKRQGKYNGYGYAQSTHSWKCFDSHAEVTGLVRAWFEKRVPVMGLPAALCYYNTGHKTADCPYYRDYLKYAKSE